jgi:spore maturation protein SpmA
VVFANSDLLVGVAERLLGLDPPAAIAIMERLAPLKEKKRRAALRRLNFILSTTALEALTPHGVVELLGVD